MRKLQAVRLRRRHVRRSLAIRATPSYLHRILQLLPLPQLQQRAGQGVRRGLVLLPRQQAAVDVGQRLSPEQLRPVQQPRKPRGMLGLLLLQLNQQWIGSFRPYASACCLSLRVGAAAGVAVAAADAVAVANGPAVPPPLPPALPQKGADPQWGGGAIVTMSSVNAVMAIPSIAGYNASKGGVNGLTRCMSLALAPHGIRVNSVGPGSIATDVLASVASDEAARNRILSRTPLGRIGEPDEIGEVVAFLASDSSSYMTGQVLYVDGGRLALNYTV